MASPTRNVHYDIEATPSDPNDQSRLGAAHSIHSEPENSHLPHAPILKRRETRSSTFRTVNENLTQVNWRPGQEPGLDPSKPNGGRSHTPTLHEECQITVVDFSEEDMYMRDMDNAQLIAFLQEDQEDWIKCRWINVNGLSWDVIQALGKYKKLHRLAIEDLVNTNNRTKADWYADHTYILLTLQKLVHLRPDEEDSDFDSDDESPHIVGEGRKRHRRGPLMKMMRKIWPSTKGKSSNGDRPEPGNFAAGAHDPTNGRVPAHSYGTSSAGAEKLRTLQRYHRGPNQERMAFMEAHSALTKKRLAVSAEQVSIFLTADNTVISFFESSADDIELPILSRLSTADTILRQSCDASMITQAIIDAIIDLAIPVSNAYQDVIGELELDVLTQPSMTHVTGLYIVMSEITSMRNLFLPIVNLINSLRDHKINTIGDVGPSQAKRAVSSMKISPTAQTYFADVEDHCVLITQSLDQMRRSADGMIDLIFNTISAFQNESMKQLTTVTIIFLPMTFITGYFGMNFDDFASIHNNERFFWSIALPVAIGTIIIMMREVIHRWFVKTVQRRGISKNRRRRLQREAELKRNQ